MSEMPKAYDARETEPRWYAFWEERGALPRERRPERHAHALHDRDPAAERDGLAPHGARVPDTFEDVLIRHKRMQGRNALWIPGTDHAGIATQVVVERQLRREGKTRGTTSVARRSSSASGSGRRRPAAASSGSWRSWARPPTGRASGSRWTRGSRARVREAFVRLYEEGLIYRATRLINWDVACMTALSDLEVENEEKSKARCSTSPTRSPRRGRRRGRGLDDAARDDARRHGGRRASRRPALHAPPRQVRAAPVLGPRRSRSSPTRSSSTRSFGTGAVKVTPAHDFNDFATGKRHGLDEINILELDGNDEPRRRAVRGDGPLRRRARRSRRGSRSSGLARGAKKHVMTLPRCQRSDTIVEPMISTQWFVKMEPLAEPAIEAVRERPHRDPARGVEEDLLPLDARTSRTGASRGSSGGGTGSRRGTARRRARERRAREAPTACGECDETRSGRTRTCSTRGSQLRAVAVLDAGLAGGHGGRSAEVLPDRATWRRATTSCSSGWRG